MANCWSGLAFAAVGGGRPSRKPTVTMTVHFLPMNASMFGA